MVWHAVRKWFYVHGWSSLCIVAPVMLGFFALDRTASMLTHQATGLKLPYEFLSARDLPRAASMAEIKQLDEDLAVTLLAKDLHGRASYAVASALLYLASAAAIGYGFLVVRRRNRTRIAFEALLLVVFLGYIVASTPAAFDLLRPLVVEHILDAANKLSPPMNSLASGDADRSWFNQVVGFFFRHADQFGDPAVTGLVRLNSIIGLIAVGMLLAALASASDRPETPQAYKELLERREIMRCVLALGAAVLVVSVVCSKVLIEWPASLLSNSQQKAIAPIGDALNLMFAASCTMALIAALGPALVAFRLDRRAFADNQQAATIKAAMQDQGPAYAAPAQRFADDFGWFADDLGFAPWPSISAAIAVVSPLLASPLLGLVASIVKTSHS